MGLRFSGYRVLVTGSTRGIGRAIAERLASEGAVVGVHGRRAADAQGVAAEIERAFPFDADLARADRGAELVERFVDRAGGIDGLVNNAGGGEPGAFRGVTLEAWRATFATNVDAAMTATQAAYRAMRTQKRGGIVNVASLAAHGASGWMSADYGASKAALLSLTRSFALEAGRWGIRCNAVSPGFVETDMTASMPQAARDSLRVPLGGLGRAEDVAAAVAFLLSDDARYVTGQVLHVDGGLWMGG